MQNYFLKDLASKTSIKSIKPSFNIKNEEYDIWHNAIGIRNLFAKRRRNQWRLSKPSSSQ
jgi:hypothetical protein